MNFIRKKEKKKFGHFLMNGWHFIWVIYAYEKANESAFIFNKYNIKNLYSFMCYICNANYVISGWYIFNFQGVHEHPVHPVVFWCRRGQGYDAPPLDDNTVNLSLSLYNNILGREYRDW